MKSRGLNTLDRGRKRALDHRGTRTDRAPRVAHEHPYLSGTVCDGCGAVYSRKTWRGPGERAAEASARER